MVELDIGIFFGVLVGVVDEEELLESSESESDSSSELLSSVSSELSSSSSDVVDNEDRLVDDDGLRLFPLEVDGIAADVDCDVAAVVATVDDRFLFETFAAAVNGDDSFSSSDESLDEPELDEPLDDDSDDDDDADDDDDDADNVRLRGTCNDSFGHAGDVNIDFVNDC